MKMKSMMFNDAVNDLVAMTRQHFAVMCGIISNREVLGIYVLLRQGEEQLTLHQMDPVSLNLSDEMSLDSWRHLIGKADMVSYMGVDEIDAVGTAKAWKKFLAGDGVRIIKRERRMKP